MFFLQVDNKLPKLIASEKLPTVKLLATFLASKQIIAAIFIAGIEIDNCKARLQIFSYVNVQQTLYYIVYYQSGKKNTKETYLKEK